MRKFIHLWLVLFILASVSCGHALTKLEFDRMVGTAFPTDQTLDGEDYSLTTIYSKSETGNIISVNEDDTNIAALTGAHDASDPDQYDYVTDAELDALETANRSYQIGPLEEECGLFRRQECTRYHVYGIVTDHFREKDDGTRVETILGRMWDTTDRGAFAIFYKHNTISTDGLKYLRTTAHEIGHAYNLHHSDGDGSETIMNQTSTVGNTFTYEFSADSKTHLKDHPVGCSRPGTGIFQGHGTNHAGQACNP